MKVVIAGSRGITSYDLVRDFIESVEEAHMLPKKDITQVVSGGAPGVDSLGEQWARDNEISVRRFLPDWEKYGKAAGPIRNREMVDYTDAVIAIWDGKSRGTKSTIDYARSKGKPVYIHRIGFNPVANMPEVIQPDELKITHRKIQDGSIDYDW
jgi:hypothetical protein